MALVLPIGAQANELLYSNPLALVTAMLLDQQIPLERAFAAPYELSRRLGRDLDAADLAGRDLDELTAVFAQRPALHRFPKAMASRVHDLARLVVDRYDGDAARIWTTAGSGTELLTRVAALPGFGDQKARIFVALLGKQFGVQPPGWREAAGGYAGDGTFLSVADIADEQALHEVRAYKKRLKAATAAGAQPPPD